MGKERGKREERERKERGRRDYVSVFLLFSVDCELWMADFFDLYWYFCSCDWFLSFVLCCVMLVRGLGFLFGAGLGTARCSIIFDDSFGGKWGCMWIWRIGNIGTRYLVNRIHELR